MKTRPKLHLDHYFPEFCDVYLTRGTAKHRKGSHPVAVIRGDRDTRESLVWKPVLFVPWQPPVDLLVQLLS